MPQTCKSSVGWLVRKDRFNSSGERVSNTWAICPEDGDNLGKPGLIPDTLTGWHHLVWKGRKTLQDEPAAYQLVGGVTAHQGDDA